MVPPRSKFDGPGWSNFHPALQIPVQWGKEKLHLLFDPLVVSILLCFCFVSGWFYSCSHVTKIKFHFTRKTSPQIGFHLKWLANQIWNIVLLKQKMLSCLSDFLEDMYPGKTQLFPKDPYEKHKQRLLVEVLCNKVYTSFAKLTYRICYYQDNFKCWCPFILTASLWYFFLIQRQHWKLQSFRAKSNPQFLLFKLCINLITSWLTKPKPIT